MSRMHWVCSRFSGWHLWAAVVIWAAFSGVTFALVSTGLDDAEPITVAATTLGVLLGPMTGAISRDFQSCCTEFSLSLLPYCLGALLAGTLVQLATPPRNAWFASVRVIAWVAALIGWFGGSLVSLGHALS